MHGTFVALDFETADHRPDSACAIGMVRVQDGMIVARREALIRPPRQKVLFTAIHGLRWEDLAGASSFGRVWSEMKPLLEGVRFVAAHNAAFDERVLRACCQAARRAVPDVPFLCTVRLARATWPLPHYGLADVCEKLGLPLRHHNALSDATACARIVLCARARRMPARRARSAGQGASAKTTANGR
jgi:DNA polymerase-3 subunit epsilon